jgi:hypothetical protein
MPMHIGGYTEVDVGNPLRFIHPSLLSPRQLRTEGVISMCAEYLAVSSSHDPIVSSARQACCADLTSMPGGMELELGGERGTRL